MSSDKERLVWSDLVHWIVTGVAALAACFLIWAMLFGTKPLNDYVEGMGVERTLRERFQIPAQHRREHGGSTPYQQDSDSLARSVYGTLSGLRLAYANSVSARGCLC